MLHVENSRYVNFHLVLRVCLNLSRYSHFLLYLQNYTEFEAEILDLQSEKYGLSFDIKKYTTSGCALGDENVFGIRSFKCIWCYIKKKELLNNSGMIVSYNNSTDEIWNGYCFKKNVFFCIFFYSYLPLPSFKVQVFTNDYNFCVSVNKYK